MQHCKYSLSDLEDMIPWEREIYLGLLQNYVKLEKQKLEAERAKMKANR